MSEVLQPHGGHATEGYGRPKEQGADFTHGIALAGAARSVRRRA